MITTASGLREPFYTRRIVMQKLQYKLQSLQMNFERFFCKIYSKIIIDMSMKSLNIKKCLFAVISLAAFGPISAQEIVVAASDISIYEEGDASVNLGNRVWSWSAADDASIPSRFKVHFKTYCEVKPVAGGKEFLVAASEGGWAIVDREKKKARKCGLKLFCKM